VDVSALSRPNPTRERPFTIRLHPDFRSPTGRTAPTSLAADPIDLRIDQKRPPAKPRSCGISQRGATCRLLGIIVAFPLDRKGLRNTARAK